MRKIFLFMVLSLDGFFEGPDHDLSWHPADAESNEFSSKQAQAKQVDTLLFGRRTYELMASYWPTETAKRDDPIVAEFMNNTPKIVFSRTMNKAEWNNTKIVNERVDEEVRKLKDRDGRQIAIFGSNNLAVNLMQNGLVDEVQVMLTPVILGSGTPLFQGIKDKLNLKLISERAFKSGNILLSYKPIRGTLDEPA